MSIVYRHGRKYSSIIGKQQPVEPSKKKFDAYCGYFFCNIMDEAVCCSGCPRFMKCDFACLNSPENCGLCIGPDEE